MNPKRCKRCGHTEAYAGPFYGDICGNCGDDLRQEMEAERAADLLPTFEERIFDARQEQAYKEQS